MMNGDFCIQSFEQRGRTRTWCRMTMVAVKGIMMVVIMFKFFSIDLLGIGEEMRMEEEKRILPFYKPREDHRFFDVLHEQQQNHLCQVHGLFHSARNEICIRIHFSCHHIRLLFLLTTLQMTNFFRSIGEKKQSRGINLLM